MKAPDSIKEIVNKILDDHWQDILEGNEFSDVIYDSSYNLCRIKLQYGKEGPSKIGSDKYIIRIITKWMM